MRADPGASRGGHPGDTRQGATVALQTRRVSGIRFLARPGSFRFSDRGRMVAASVSMQCSQFVKLAGVGLAQQSL